MADLGSVPPSPVPPAPQIGVLPLLPLDQLPPDNQPLAHPVGDYAWLDAQVNNANDPINFTPPQAPIPFNGLAFEHDFNHHGDPDVEQWVPDHDAFDGQAPGQGDFDLDIQPLLLLPSLFALVDLNPDFELGAAPAAIQEMAPILDMPEPQDPMEGMAVFGGEELALPGGDGNGVPAVWPPIAGDHDQLPQLEDVVQVPIAHEEEAEFEDAQHEAALPLPHDIQEAMAALALELSPWEGGDDSDLLELLVRARGDIVVLKRERADVREEPHRRTRFVSAFQSVERGIKVGSSSAKRTLRSFSRRVGEKMVRRHKDASSMLGPGRTMPSTEGFSRTA
ncbi:unnamed protein product [Peniophora sp. CBMAI 1063]|nr:unnamed protein product [Peniophora sp. CBMAI 1063]